MDSVAVLRFAFSEALEEARVMMPRKESCTPREEGSAMLLRPLAMEKDLNAFDARTTIFM